MAGTIKNLEIFGVGNHITSTGSIDVTEGDLEQIVEAFHALQGTNIVKPHLKLGHTEAQKWFGQKDGIPTLGWITKVWKLGNKLFADISNVPEELLNLLKQGRFHNVSAEIFFNAPIKHLGKQFNRVLSAVAILGVEMPAVKDLAGLAEALFTTEPLCEFSDPLPLALTFKQKDDFMPDKKGDPVGFTQEQVDALISSAVDKDRKEFRAKHDSELKSVKDELKVIIERAESAEAEIIKVKAESANKEAITLVDQAIKDGKILPKHKEFAMAFMTAESTKVKFGDKGEEKSLPELFKSFLETQGKQVDLGENGSGENHQENFATAAHEVDFLTKKAMLKSDKLNYSDALAQVLAADPKLKTRYADGQV